MRKKLFMRLCSLGLIAAMAVATVGYPAYATIDDEKNKINDLQQEKSDVQSVIDGLQKDKSAIEENIKALDTELSNISSKLYDTQKNLSSVSKKIEKNNIKLEEAKKSINEQYASMKLRIQFMYENGNQEMLSLILSSESIGDFLNKAEYISELSSYDRKMLDKMQETKQTIETTQKTLNEQKKTLTALETKQKQQKSDVETLVTEKQNQISEYDSKIAKNQDALDELDTAIGNQQSVIDEMERIEAERKKKQAEEASRKAEEARKAAAASSSTSSGNSGSSSSSGGSSSHSKPSSAGFIWPLPGYSSISSGFGGRSDPFTGQATYHSGIDIPAPSGTSIVAAASGQVAWANYSTTAGNWIGIDHGNGLYTVYMHMSALLVSAGQSVSQGQTIGLVGTTGSSTGNHLHFSVRLNGSYVSPLSYVSP